MATLSGLSKRASAAAALGFLIVLGAGGSRASAARTDLLAYYSFSRPVALPGVTLAPGTYAFEVRDPNTANNVILVRDRTRSRSLFSGFTHRALRPQNWNEKRQIVLGEAAPGEAAPILAWYPVDTATGYEFIYPR